MKTLDWKPTGSAPRALLIGHDPHEFRKLVNYFSTLNQIFKEKTY